MREWIFAAGFAAAVALSLILARWRPSRLCRALLLPLALLPALLGGMGLAISTGNLADLRASPDTRPLQEQVYERKLIPQGRADLAVGLAVSGLTVGIWLAWVLRPGEKKAGNPAAPAGDPAGKREG